MQGQQNLRNFGSIHSDTWRGTAAQLDSARLISIYPVTGQWRECRRLELSGRQVPYSPVISIRAQEVEADICTTISNLVGIKVSI